jgi:hypothetical protein
MMTKEVRSCACGCGKTKEVKVNKPWRYYSGHHPNSHLKGRKGRPFVSREIRNCACGCGNTFKCKVISHKKYIYGHQNIGRTCLVETRQKLCLAHTGKIVSIKTRQKQSLSQQGKKRKPLSEETKLRLSNLHKGSKCNFWKGGITPKLYPEAWTKVLKRSIRERDNWTCQICSSDHSIDVHHIDYNKQNCLPDNLVTLCHSCHIKINSNREYWIKYFENRRQYVGEMVAI